MRVIRGFIECGRPAAFKAPHLGERDPAGDTGLSAGHLHSNRARLMAERDKIWIEYLRIFNMIKGIEFAIKVLSKT